MLLDVRPEVLAVQEVRFASGEGGVRGPCQVSTLADWLADYQVCSDVNDVGETYM